MLYKTFSNPKPVGMDKCNKWKYLLLQWDTRILYRLLTES